ncbi:nicotinamide mononucleotide transporter family protein [Kitasatospora cineracea]|uniref:Nicotinamide mononucleotide transporter n=1 Tax=Kitasatospora cineracea TaxID=88074 RepID=A0A3N4RRI3_9ACTN|nr:nicotinamide mononucleotide transporter family protein [Kitasatospora cineracea]RPE36038.1 nicotinamide mononucleotide transporter [Kitasatospora cineracea]
MSSFAELTFTAFGEQVKVADMVGNLIGLTGLVLGWRRSVLTWPVQLLAGAVLITAFWNSHMPGLIGKQAIVVVASVWGWMQWRRDRRDTGQVEVRFATWTERAVLVAATAAGTAAVAWLFHLSPKLSYAPLFDAYIFVGTLAAMYAQARGWVEFWFAWLAVDLIGVPYAYQHGYSFTALTFTVYFVLVVAGLVSWWTKARTDRTAPLAKGVTA